MTQNYSEIWEILRKFAIFVRKDADVHNLQTPSSLPHVRERPLLADPLPPPWRASFMKGPLPLTPTHSYLIPSP